MCPLSGLRTSAALLNFNHLCWEINNKEAKKLNPTIQFSTFLENQGNKTLSPSAHLGLPWQYLQHGLPSRPASKNVPAASEECCAEKTAGN